MARPRESYSVRKPTNAASYYIFVRDHLDIKRKIRGKKDKTTTEYIGKNLAAIINLRSTNQPLTSDLRSFIENQPKSLRNKLLEWDIIDSNTNASFEPLVESVKVKAKNSNKMIYEVTGGHLFYWQKSMEDNRRTKQHIKESVARVVRLMKACRFHAPSDINGEKVKSWLSDIDSPSKANGYLGSFKSFIRWMLKTNRMSENPIQYLQALKVLEKELIRRALIQKEIRRLLTATIDGKDHHGLTGYERCLVYRIAMTSGLRYNEIRLLKRKDFTFGSDLSITVQAGSAKNRKKDTLPLQEDLADDLDQYFKGKPAVPQTRAFKMWKDVGAAMLKEDLVVAEIPIETEQGVCDFHSLRHTFGTLLARSGVLPQEAQRLMRHQDINLTMNIYTHLLLSDKAKAISKLPSIRPQRARQVKTGILTLF